MPVDYLKYRASAAEQARVADFLNLLPRQRRTVLEIGARDGYFSRLLTNHFFQVTALDLQKPLIDIPRVKPVKGDVTSLEFPDNYFDVVCCTEVLEHIESSLLQQACNEITRVARCEVLIGVPFRQDRRVGRTTCNACLRHNPPYGHVNSFDQTALQELFSELDLISFTFTGKTKEVTNPVSALLMDLAGNPWGTYAQEEPCIFCGAPLRPPKRRALVRRAMAASAEYMNRLQRTFTPALPLWIHGVFQKRTECSARS